MTNYAEAYGIHSLAAAIVFIVCYAPFIPYFIFKSIRNPTFVYIMLSIFCVIRITAFVLRAVLVESASAASSLNLLIVEQVIYNVGFFGVLFSAYTLVLDLQLLSNIEIRNPIQYLTSNKSIIGTTMSAAVAVGVVGAVDLSSSSASSQALGKTLRIVSVALFLGIVVLMGIHTLLVLKESSGLRSKQMGEASSFGRTHGLHILVIITTLLLIREVFYIATIENMKVQTNEAYFYPLGALPELLVVMLFATPGLVPHKSELPRGRETGIIFIDLYRMIKDRA